MANNKEWNASKVQARTNELASQFRNYPGKRPSREADAFSSSRGEETFDEMRKNDLNLYKFLEHVHAWDIMRQKEREAVVEFLLATQAPFYVQTAKIIRYLGTRPERKLIDKMDIDKRIIKAAPREPESITSNWGYLYAATAKTIGKIEKQNKRDIAKMGRKEKRKLRKIKSIYNLVNIDYIYYTIIKEYGFTTKVGEVVTPDRIRSTVMKDQQRAIRMLDETGFFDKISREEVQKFSR